MILDIHIHTKRCHHAEGDIEDYIKKAIKDNVKIIGFSEHAPLLFDTDKRLSLVEALTYISDINKMKIKYKGKIKILCGFEIDYVEKYEKEIKDFIKSTKADYFLGSIHFILLGDKMYNVWDYKSISSNKKLQKEYFRLMIKAINTGLFNSICHPDLIFRSGIKQFILDNDFNKVFSALVKNDVGYEINCSGSFKTKYNYNDDEMLLESYFSKTNLINASKKGVWFTIGSDAHKISDLGKGVKEMLKFSEEHDLNIFYFENKNKIKFEGYL